MSDELGLHRMENPSHVDGCVSLHLYIPPFDECKVFDERTGRSSKSLVTFFTKYGKKIDYRGSRQGIIKSEDPSQEVQRSPHSFV
uniref:Cysteine dioxygenase n=1 Tax=Panagrolaimus superbus TaxID=310955 RepID=A0A914YXJ8_9BILA